MGQSANGDCALEARRVRVPSLRTIDRNQLEDIGTSPGPAKLARLLELARSELAERPRAIRQCAERQDFARLRSEAHNFKGAVASIGLVGVALAAKAVELAAPGTELELALSRLDGEAIHARVALARVTSGEPLDVAVNG